MVAISDIGFVIAKSIANHIGSISCSTVFLIVAYAFRADVYFGWCCKLANRKISKTCNLATLVN
jgi:hypothetical protein